MRCTKHEDRGKATRAAIQLEDEALREAGAKEEDAKTIMTILREAGEKATQKKLTLDLGREYLRRLVTISAGQSLKVWTVRDWLNEWLNQKIVKAKPATQARYGHSVKAFLDYVGALADTPIEHLNVQHIRQFRDKLSAEGRAAKTCNGYTKDIGMALHAAVKERILQHSPASNLDALPEDDSVERMPFSLVEVQKLVKAAPSDDWRGVILLGAFGGLRIGDAATLKVDNLNLTDHLICFVPQKSSRRKGSAITLPMHTELIAFFKANPPSKIAGAPCFPSLCKITVGGHWGLSTSFSKIMTKAGVLRGAGRIHIKGTAGRSVYSRSFHSLRHSFNSWMLNTGVSQETRQELVGHADKETNKGYSHHQLNTLRAAVKSVHGFAKKRRSAKTESSQT